MFLAFKKILGNLVRIKIRELQKTSRLNHYMNLIRGRLKKIKRLNIAGSIHNHKLFNHTHKTSNTSHKEKKGFRVQKA